jgi:hypothetical protein
VEEGGVLLDLGHQLDPLRDQGPELVELLGPPDERDADVVHAELDGVLHVLPVLVRDRRRADIHAGEVHPLVGLQEPAVAHDPVHPVSPDAGHLHREQAVVEEDLRAGVHVLRHGVGGGSSVRCHRLRGKGDGLPLDEVPRLRELADPDPGAVEVHQDRHGLCAPLLDSLEVADPLGPQLPRPVGGVDPDDVHPGVEELGHAVGMRPGGAERGDDLGAADGGARHVGLNNGSGGIVTEEGQRGSGAGCQ